MTRLDCSVKNWYFNNEMKCAKDEIQVEGKEATTTDSTECSSFRMNNSTAKNSTGCKLTPNEELKEHAEAAEDALRASIRLEEGAEEYGLEVKSL